MTDPLSEKPSLAVFVDGIGKPEFILWHDSLKAIVTDENSILVKSSDLSESDSAFLSKTIPDKKILPADETRSLDKQPKAFFFTNTANCISIPADLPPEIRKACLLGGLGRPSYSHQLTKSLELNFDFFFSDVLPEEIHHCLDPDQNSHFEKQSLFLPPDSETNSVSQNSSEEKILFVYYEDEGADLTLFEQIFRKTLKELKQARLVNLTNAPVEDWLELCSPVKDCNVLVTNFNSPPLQHYLSQLCASRGMNFHSLSTKAPTSPIRTYLTNNLILSDWLGQISPIRTPSLRQTFNEIINRPKDQDAKVTQNSSDDRFFIPAIRGYLMEEKCSDESGQRLENIRNFYQKRNSSSDNSGNKLHYLNNPIQHLLQNEPNSHLIETALLFHSESPLIESSAQCLVALMECCLRSSAALVQDQGAYLAYYRLLILSPTAFLLSFKNVFALGRNEKAYVDLAAAVLQMVQTRYIDQKFRDLFLAGFQKMPPSQNLASRSFLARKQFDLFDNSIKQAWHNSDRESAGAAIYAKLFQDPNLNQTELNNLKEICNQEISRELDGLRTHFSLAVIKILLNEDTDVSQILAKPANPRNDFGRFPSVWHQIALFSLFQNRQNEAKKLLLCPTEANGGNSALGRIGALAISILVEDYDRAESFASEFPKELISSVWDPVFPPYFSALYHGIIFKFCGFPDELERSLSIMDKDKVSLHSRLRKLLDKVPYGESIPPALQKIADSLAEKI